MVSDVEVSGVLSLLLARSLSSYAFSFYTLAQFFLSSGKWESLKLTLKLLVCGCVCICAQIFFCMLRHLQRPGIESSIPWNWRGYGSPDMSVGSRIASLNWVFIRLVNGHVWGDCLDVGGPNLL